MSYSPLVSVGMPTYNRPHSLRRALECMTKQTYSNLEIVISDNCSPNGETDAVVKEFSELDSRIIFYKQKENVGIARNFNAVLEKATGEYFMWAADDDEWEDNFIELCVTELNRLGPDYVAAITEVQYFSDDERFDFFSEGQPFYGFFSLDVMDRMMHMLKYCYGNLSYSLFRRQVLLHTNGTIFDYLEPKSLNEIPLLLYIAQHGNWVVSPEIAFYKRTNINTYEQAKWEKVGGKLPNSKGLLYYRYLPRNFGYHRQAKKDIFSAIELLDLNLLDKTKLKSIAFALLTKHLGAFAVKRKKRAF